MKLPGETKREMLVRSDDKAQGYGKDPYSRTVKELLEKGVINLDKPPGPTSHEVAAWVKDILHIKRAGHSGTLDPHVTGVLPMMLGDATRLVSTLLLSGKEYVCVMRLHADIPPSKLKSVMGEFEGVIYQRPPLVSAVKRQVRKRTIYYLELLEIDGRDVLFRVGCEAGTYIRKLCHDIGEALGPGAHMYELRRTKSGPFSEDETLVNLHTLKDAYVIYEESGDDKLLKKYLYPMEFGLRHLPKIIVKDSAVDALARGAQLHVQGISQVSTGIQPGDTVAIFTHMGEVVSIGNSRMSTEELMKNAEGQAVDTDSVIIQPGIYPSQWKKKFK
ncbi:RNA-guided pseudouridylation complex pseudouridine synthase subunit Cbf5 [Methanocella sp. CWC-04]|uniref:Probable tRNA pseudouridine synthase B n=1 Tax=Methanooceanicella nereidis TaxID=2052831 RepID=A0AAP2W5V1_9EURY|nr:RNA-guided pseudouridylation complex pseudouridine synthase subunit Cbf5 [Methanocella sp. CWC-04]MCD1293486.1 RNA-guided pseudouridylation complex pseudouridine synthase subunit Cbf5 [Methanocella sp. CWC-04]